MRFFLYPIVLLLCSHALAADGYGNLSGTVFDSAGDPAPLAHVTLARRPAGPHREVVANQQGNYEVQRLAEGTYTVLARSPRTSASTRVTVIIRAGETVALPMVLSETWLAVKSQPPLDGSHYLDTIRNASEVTRGQEGGNIEGYTPYSPRGNAALNSIGQRGQNNNFRVDGLDNNEPWLRGVVLEPPGEAIQSVSLAAVYLPAALGHATGSSVDVGTKSGSGRFHGAVYERLRNSVLNARNFFDGAAKPGLTGNQFGAGLGGPIRPDRWFFFADSEWLRERRGLTLISTVPTVDEKDGNFGVVPVYDPHTIIQRSDGIFIRQPFAGNRIPETAIPQAARNVIALYPDPNLPGAANNYRFTPAEVRNSGWLNGRSDKILSAASTLFARFSYERQNRQSPGALPAGSSDVAQHADGAVTNLTAWGGGISHTYVIGPATINEFRAGITRLDLSGYPNDRGVDASALLAIPGLGAGGLPVISPTGFATLGAAEAVPMSLRSTSYQVEDTVLWKTARHTWEFGLQAIRRHVDGDVPEWTSRGTFFFSPDYTGLPGMAGTGHSVASLLTGYPLEVRRDVQFAPFQLRGWELAGFVQDELRIWKRLTVQVGLRYSLDPPLTEAQQRMVNFNYSRVTPALDQFAGQGGVNRFGGLGFDKRTLAPRLGFAVDLFGNGATVLRGYFSKSYDAGAYAVLGNLARNPPFAARLDQINGTFQLGPSLAAGLPEARPVALLDTATLNAAQGAVYAIEFRDYTPYSNQWGLAVQQRLRPRLVLEIGGAGSMGMHLLEAYDSNQPYPAPTPYNYPRYPYRPYFGRIDYLGFAGGSTYYGGQVKLAGQATARLQLLMTYRFAKSVDDSNPPGTGQESRPTGPQYIYNLRGNRSPSPFDIAHRLVVTASYELPFRKAAAGAGVHERLFQAVLADWRAGAIVLMQTGLPFTPQLAVNSLNNGGYQLPDRVADGALPASQRSYMHWFNTSLDPADPNRAFEIPALYQYGNAGFDILRGPGMATVDASLARSFQVGERLRLETRLEAANLLNRTNFALPNRILGLEASGVISHTSTPARNIHVGARLQW